MARPKTPTVEVTERLRPVAAPVSAYVRPAEPERSPLWELAKSLSTLSSGLGSFVEGRQAETAAADKAQAKLDAVRDNAEGFAEGVRSDRIPTFASPAYMDSYKATQGSVAGMRLEQKFNLDYDAWEGKNGEDPRAFDEFLKGWIRENVPKDTDRRSTVGLAPHIDRILTTAQTRFYKDLNDNLYSKNLTTRAAEVGLILQNAHTEGTGREGGADYEETWKTVLQKREDAIKSGTRSEDFDKKLVETLQAEAIRLRDPRILDLLGRTLPGTNYKIGDTEEGRKAQMEGRHRLEVINRQDLHERRLDDERRDKLAKQQFTREAIEVLFQDPSKPLSESLLAAGSRYDPDFRINVLDWQKKILEGGVLEDPRRIGELYDDIFRGGGLEAVKRGIANGTLASAESRQKAMSFLKTIEGEGGKKVLTGSAHDNTMRLIREKLKDPRLVDPLDPNSGLTEAGRQAQFEYQQRLVEWRAANPTADDLAIMRAQNEIGTAILGGIADNGPSQPRTYQGPQHPNPSAPSSPAPPPALAIPSAPAQPPGDWWRDNTPPPAGSPYSDPAFQQRRTEWLKGLSTTKPEQLRAIEERAKARGVTPREQSEQLFERMERLRGRQGMLQEGGGLATPAPSSSPVSVPVRNEGEAFSDYLNRVLSGDVPLGNVADTVRAAMAYLNPVSSAAAATAPSAQRIRPLALNADQQSIKQQVRAAAEGAGLPADAVAAIVAQESGFNPATRPRGRDGRLLSSATGLFQLLNGDRKEYGLDADASVDEQISVGIRKTRDNWMAARRALGRDPTPGELYVVHYQGRGAGPAILRNPGEDFITILDAWGARNGVRNWGQKVANANPWLLRQGIRTGQDFIDWCTRKMTTRMAQLGSARG